MAAADVYRRFWGGLLERPAARSKIFDRAKPTSKHYLVLPVGPGGLSLICAMRVTKPDAYVSLRIARGSKDENDRVFAALFAARERIEESFGLALEWCPADQGEDQRTVRHGIASDALDNLEADGWRTLHERIIDAAIRFDLALRDEITQLVAPPAVSADVTGPRMADEINQEERAAKAWPILAESAADGRTITYKELSDGVGVHHRAASWFLGPIQEYCLSEKLPPLTILVVQGGASGRPGGGFVAWDVSDFDEGLRRVFEFNWRAISNPFAYALAQGQTQQQLVDALVETPERAEAVYRLIHVRGIAQQVFRDALRRAYDDTCAFCGMSFPEALDGAHIVPWADCEPAERLDVRNGLLLCATHHRLFDSGSMTVDRDLVIHHVEAEGEYSPSDEQLTRTLDGRPLRSPSRPSLRADPRYVVRRYT